MFLHKGEGVRTWTLEAGTLKPHLGSVVTLGKDLIL